MLIENLEFFPKSFQISISFFRKNCGKTSTNFEKLISALLRGSSGGPQPEACEVIKIIVETSMATPNYLKVLMEILPFFKIFIFFF